MTKKAILSLCYLLRLFLALRVCEKAGLAGNDGIESTGAAAGSDGPGLDLGTEGDGSGFGTATSFAPPASSPQWGQNLQSFKMEAQSL